jgi:hypothetical protein
MATVEHHLYQYDRGSAGLRPQQALWVSFGPDDRFKDSTVIMTAHPSTLVAGTTIDQANVLSVGDVFATTVPIPGGIVLREYHVGANVTNAGQHPIRYFTLYLTIIRP